MADDPARGRRRAARRHGHRPSPARTPASRSARAAPRPRRSRSSPTAPSTIDGAATSDRDAIHIDGASYVTIEGFTITHAARAGISALDCDHITIKRQHAPTRTASGASSRRSATTSPIEDNEASRSGDAARHLRVEQRRPPGHPRQHDLGQRDVRHPHERRHLAGRRRRDLERARRGQRHLRQRHARRLGDQRRRRDRLGDPQQRARRQPRARASRCTRSTAARRRPATSSSTTRSAWRTTRGSRSTSRTARRQRRSATTSCSTRRRAAARSTSAPTSLPGLVSDHNAVDRRVVDRRQRA